MGGHQAAAALDELADLLALRVRERRDIRQDQSLEAVDVRGVEQPVVHHLERNARFDQRLVEAERVIFDFGLRRSPP